MKLSIERKQNKPSLGIHQFEVSFKLEFSVEEAELVKTYRQESRKIGGWDVKWFLKSAVPFQKDNVFEALEFEEQVKKDVQGLKEYLETAKSYGGKTEVSF